MGESQNKESSHDGLFPSRVKIKRNIFHENMGQGVVLKY